jgi:myo-inositol 2-dehydrogenase / D-chiro-inositol 1-dehydrogenase
MTAPTSQDRARRRIGFVGTGGVADRHASVLAGFDDVELVAAADVDPERAAAFAQRHGTAAVDDLDALVGCDLHAVYVCVPPFAHGDVEVRLAAAGLALFVEKPLAADEATAQRVADALDRAGVPTRVGLHWRCAEPVRRARELLADRPVRLVGATWLDKVPPVPWWTDRERSGGPLVEQAVHVLDTARVLVGEVESVHAASAGPVPGGSTDAATAALLRFAGGAVGTAATTCVLGRKHRAGVEVVADGLALGVGEDWLEVDDGSGPRREEFDRRAALVAADREFVDALDGAAPGAAVPPLALPDHREALRSHRLACALARSAATGEPERVA